MVQLCSCQTTRRGEDSALRRRPAQEYRGGALHIHVPRHAAIVWFAYALLRRAMKGRGQPRWPALLR
jgi:hypothetical protein